MRVKFLGTGQSPDYYEFNGDVVTAHSGGQSESFDLSVLEHGDKFEGIEPAILDLPDLQIIRAAYRDEHGELHVTLTEKSPMRGHWRDSEWMDSSEYYSGNAGRHFRQLVDETLVEQTKPYVKINDEWVEAALVEEE